LFDIDGIKLGLVVIDGVNEGWPDGLRLTDGLSDGLDDGSVDGSDVGDSEGASLGISIIKP
jgi:hypothetical protein